MNGKKLGRMGEEIAADYLEANGFKIVERNFRCRIGEMDIIASRAGELYFVEVKTRSDDRFGGPFESITLRKQRQITNIAKYFLSRKRAEVNCHFSVIGICPDKNGHMGVKFLPDAWGID